MCGRYYLHFMTAHLQKIKEILDTNTTIKYHTGEIFPTNLVPVLVLQKGNLTPTVMHWGFKNTWDNKVIINARSETVFQKPMFQQALQTNRCVIPADGFYEWKKTNHKNKDKYYFQNTENPTIYMAGIYQIVNGEKYFTILTKEANESMCNYHHRMPIILQQQEVLSWLSKPQELSTIMLTASPTLLSTKVK